MYKVVGVDCSQEMINSAKTKAEAKNLHCNFRLADIRQLDLNRKFDTVVMMFAVLGYQLENADVLAALKSARKHLNSGGLLILANSFRRFGYTSPDLHCALSSLAIKW